MPLRGRGPESERSVDVHPRAVLVRDVADLGERIERGPSSHCPPARQRSSVRRREKSVAASAAGRIAPCASASTTSSDDAPIRDTATSGRWCCAAPHRRRAGRAARLASRRGRDPTRARLEHGMTSSRQRGEVRHHAAGDECERHVGRQAEHRCELAAYRVLASGRRGRGRRQPRVLIPRCRQHVGGQCRVEMPSDHESEVATARHSFESRRRSLDEVVDHVGRRTTLLRHVSRETPWPCRERRRGRAPVARRASPGSRRRGRRQRVAGRGDRSPRGSNRGGERPPPK